MKTSLLIILLITLALITNAQNYKCVQPGQQSYFINASGYLRGIRIDSVKNTGQITLLYPFHSPRGYYQNNQHVHIHSGSWLGKTITVLPDGTHLFDNFWGDTVIIHTQAALNDTWNIYDDNTDTFYTATVTGIDTMTVLNSIDSVKAITIHAYNSNGMLGNDPLNNERILLSKNHGLLRVCDLFVFPLHEPGKSYQPGFDYFLDTYTQNGNGKNLFFTITGFNNPAMSEIYDFQPGDFLEYQSSDIQATSSQELTTIQTIDAKLNTPQEITYTVSGWTYKKILPGPPQHSTTPYTGQFKVPAQQELMDLSKMPEETGQPYFFYYNPDDTSFCTQSPTYTISDNFIIDSTINTFEPCGSGHTYKTGLGQIMYGRCDDPPAYGHSEYLIYAKRNGTGTGCGHFIPLSIANAAAGDNTSIWPNPAHTNINISTNKTLQSVVLTNTLGRVVGTYQPAAEKIKIPVLGLPAGTYFLCIIDMHNVRTYRKMQVVH